MLTFLTFVFKHRQDRIYLFFRNSDSAHGHHFTKTKNEKYIPSVYIHAHISVDLHVCHIPTNNCYLFLVSFFCFFNVECNIDILLFSVRDSIFTLDNHVFTSALVFIIQLMRNYLSNWNNKKRNLSLYSLVSIHAEINKTYSTSFQ
jgi:hypothetical protein